MPNPRGSINRILDPSTLTHIEGDRFYMREKETTGKWRNRSVYRSACSLCGVEIYIRKDKYDSSYRHYCTKKCLDAGNSGPRHSRFLGEKLKHIGGYMLTYAPAHPQAHHKYILEHRAVVEKHLGRTLGRTEHVHHIDCDKRNNSLDNLVAFPSNKEHRKAHLSIDKLVPALIARDIIFFDRELGIYRMRS